jgi:MoaA/NifB/PqqE/SkfB family radical SAM enzyme
MLQEHYSDLKIVWHPEKLVSLKKGIIKAPIYVRIKPTNRCNHHCFYCVYEPSFSGIHPGMNRRDEIPYPKMVEILKNFKDMGVKAVTYSGGGEPLIYPQIENILQKTLDFNINLSIITNGQKLNGESAKILSNAFWVRVSADYCDENSFKAIRNRPKKWFYEIKENLENFAGIKKDSCTLGINFVVHKKNKDIVYKSAKFFKDLRVNNIKFTPMWSPNFFEYHNSFKEEVISQIAKSRETLSDNKFYVYDTYEKDFSLTGSSERSYERCYIMQTVPVIGADCRVYFCHNKAYSNDGVLGSIKDRSFKELWFSEEAAKIFNSFNPKKSCKHQCTNDLKNILIKDILNCLSEGVNFV